MPTHRGTFIFDANAGVPQGTWDHAEPGFASAGADGCVWIRGTSTRNARRPAAALRVAWDGRLDNRDDLLLSLDTGARNEDGDPDIALAAFERWGIEGLRSLLGDWSLAIWDAQRRTLHLARDYMGARPLYYTADPRGVAWSSDLGELVDRTGRRSALSDGFAAQFMTLRRAPGVTPYEGVRAVPAGTCVSFRAGAGETRTRFWTLQVGEIRYPQRSTYEEHLRELWRDALRARLRTAAPIWAELSGGLDSSSVVCMADALIKQRVVETPGVRLVSHATLLSPEGDERRFIAEVERQVGVRSEIVGVEDHQEHIDPDLAWVTPYALHGVGLEMVRRVRRAGGRVILSGRLGDAIMGCQPDNSVAVLDDVSRGAVFTALRNMRAWSRATRKPFLEIASGLFSPRPERSRDTAIDLLTPALRAMVSGDAAADPLKGIRRSKRALATMVLAYAEGGRLDVPSHPPGVVYTYPFADRRLVDFVLAIPGEELSAPGSTRSLMRRAFTGFVPARVLARQSKGYYPPAAFRAARRAIASLLPVDELEVVQRGWIDPQRLQQALRTLTDGSGATGADVHCVLRLESWLRARRATPAIPQRKEVKTNEVLNA
jgi:asparagine synthase (glutamine-hydrolysing)